MEFKLTNVDGGNIFSFYIILRSKMQSIKRGIEKANGPSQPVHQCQFGMAGAD